MPDGESKVVTVTHAPHRRRLLNRRESRRIVIIYHDGKFRAIRKEVEHVETDTALAGDGRYTIDIGYEGGRPYECFCDGVKIGSDIAAMIADACIAISILLQFGLTPEHLKERFSRHSDGAPASIQGVLMDVMIADREEYEAEFAATREAHSFFLDRRWAPRA